MKKTSLLLVLLAFLTLGTANASDPNNVYVNSEVVALQQSESNVTSKSFVGKWVDMRTRDEPIKYTFNQNGTLTMVVHKEQRASLGKFSCWCNIDVTISGIKWSYKDSRLTLTTSSACRVSTKVTTDMSDMTASEKAGVRSSINKIQNQFNSAMRKNISYYSGKYKIDMGETSFEMENVNGGYSARLYRQ